MDGNLVRLVEGFAGLRVLVVGDAMLDVYLEGFTRRICREAPVPVVSTNRERHVPGGAANAAVNAARLGGNVTFLGVVGRDHDGRLLRRGLAAQGVDDGPLVAAGQRRTLAKHRVIADAQMLLRFDRGSVEPVDAETQRKLAARLAHHLPQADAVILSDYGSGVFTPALIRRVAQLQRRHARVLAVDSRARLPAFRGVRPTLAKPNYREALDLLPRPRPHPRDRAEAIARYGQSILEQTGARLAAVTLDTEGAWLFEQGREPYRTYAQPRPHSQAAGAGDTFTAAFALALAAGGDPTSAAELASAAAAVVVHKDGTAACTAGELQGAISGAGKIVTDRQHLAARARLWRAQGRRIVFTNGCFDILHRGHIACLNQAKALGDVLIVAVNGDASVRRLKGPGRPVNALEDRLQVLSALSCVDCVAAFDDDTSAELIRLVRPAVFAKGGNYTREELPEVPVVEGQGGTVHLLPYLHDRSTSRMIQRIQVAGARGAPVAPDKEQNV